MSPWYKIVLNIQKNAPAIRKTQYRPYIARCTNKVYCSPADRPIICVTKPDTTEASDNIAYSVSLVCRRVTARFKG